MKTLTTITGREISIISLNKSKNTFTIKTDSAKYRTLPMSKEEFMSAQYWTGNDWQQFLKTDEYYKIK